LLAIACGLSDVGNRNQWTGSDASSREHHGAEPIDVEIEGVEMLMLSDYAYAEAGASGDDVRRLEAAYREGTARIGEVFRPVDFANALVVFCRTADCKIAFGADPRVAGASDLGFATYARFERAGEEIQRTVVVSGPDETTVRTLVHELVHVAMGRHAQYELVPTWFNEGVATLVADEPQCAGELGAGVPLETLRSKAEWQAWIEVPGRTHATYCRARAEVDVWFGGFASRGAGVGAVVAVLDAVSRGVAFELAYGPLRS
jgi:hypothetical protein